MQLLRRLPPAWRRRLRGAAERLRLGRLVDRVLRRSEPWEVTRNRRDMDNLRLVAAAVLKPDSNCIDVGAHEGSFLVEAVRVAPLGRHIAYEPLPHLASELAARFPTVDVRPHAVSDRAGRATFVHVRSRPEMSGLRTRSYPTAEELDEIEVELEALDEALPNGYVPDLIKIDVEGAEFQVLRGARETIGRHRPVVVFEHGLGGADHYGTSPGDVYRLLCHELGMRIFDLDGHGPYSESEFVAMFSSPEIWNFIAHD